MYVNVINIHSELPPMNTLSARMQEIPRPLWIAAIVLSFWFWWPLGLAVLVYRLSTRRQRQWAGMGNWRFPDAFNRAASGFSYAAPSGNRAFDEYRSETLRRLEDEQKEFVEYLERLRQARDKQEFDQFMADRRRGASRPDDVQSA